MTDSCDFELKKTKCMQNDAPSPFSSGEKLQCLLAWRAVALGGGRSVGESLTGLFPAAGRAPHVAVLHPVHLAALLPLATHLPTEGRGGSGRGRKHGDGLGTLFTKSLAFTGRHRVPGEGDGR